MARHITDDDRRKIITSNPCPPIPYRGADWCAFYDGTEETGQCGYGATEAEAIANLIEEYGEENSNG